MFCHFKLILDLGSDECLLSMSDSVLRLCKISPFIISTGDRSIFGGTLSCARTVVSQSLLFIPLADWLYKRSWKTGCDGILEISEMLNGNILVLLTRHTRNLEQLNNKYLSFSLMVCLYSWWLFSPPSLFFL